MSLQKIYAMQGASERRYTLQQVENFKHLTVEFTRFERRKSEIDTQIGKAKTDLCEVYCSVVTNL